MYNYNSDFFLYFIIANNIYLLGFDIIMKIKGVRSPPALCPILSDLGVP